MTVIRPAREEDVEAAAEMLNEHSRGLHGTDDLTPADLLMYWTSPDVELGQDILLAESADGRLGRLRGPRRPRRRRLAGRQRHRSRRRCPRCSRRSSSGRPRKSPTRSSGATRSADDAPLVDLFERHRLPAGRATRSACRSTSTEISLRPEWPDGVSVRTMREGEERRVYEAQMASFADTWMFAPDPYDELAALDGRGARRSTAPSGSSPSRKASSRGSSSRERPRTSPASAGCASWASCPSTATAASGRRLLQPHVRRVREARIRGGRARSRRREPDRRGSGLRAGRDARRADEPDLREDLT